MTYWVAAVKKTIQPCSTITTETAANVTAAAAATTMAADAGNVTEAPPAQPSASVSVTKQVEITIVNGLLVLLLLPVMKLAVSRD